MTSVYQKAGSTEGATPAWVAPPVVSLWLSVPTYLYFWFSANTIVGTALALALMLVGLAVKRPQWPYERRDFWRMQLPFFALFAVIMLSAMINPHHLVNVRKGFEYRLILLPLILGLVLPNVNNRRVLQVLCVAAIVMGLYGLYQFLFGHDPFYAYRPPLGVVGHFHRARGGFINALTYSGYLLPLVPLLAMLGLAERSTWRWIWLLGSFCAVIGIAVSMSRSAVVGLVAACLLLLFRWSRRVGIAATALVVAVVVVGIAAQSHILPELRQSALVQESGVLRRFVLIDPHDDPGVRERLLIWQAGMLGFRDRPVFGFGLGNHDPELGPYQHEVIIARGIPHYHFSVGYGVPLHNMYIRSLFDLGVVGLLTYLAMWASVFWVIARAVRSLDPADRWTAALLWGLAAGLLGSMAAGFFEDNFYDAEVQTLLLTLMLLALTTALRVFFAKRNGAARGS